MTTTGTARRPRRRRRRPRPASRGRPARRRRGSRARACGADVYGGPARAHEVLGAIVAPTLVTALLLYFGWLHAYYFFAYFGVNSTLLSLTTQDYLIRSRDGLFIPMIVIACVALLVLWGHTVLRARLAAGADPRALRILLPVTAGIGLVLTIAGVASVFVTTPLQRQLAAAPVSLALGVLLLAYAVHLRRSLPRGGTPGAPRWAAVAEWAVFVLVGLSLFWAANDYSAAVGAHARARSWRSCRPSPARSSTARTACACRRVACRRYAAGTRRAPTASVTTASRSCCSPATSTCSCHGRGPPATGWPSSCPAATRCGWSSCGRPPANACAAPAGAKTLRILRTTGRPPRWPMPPTRAAPGSASEVIGTDAQVEAS